MSKKKQIELLKFFVAEVSARKASELLEINRNTTRLFYQKIREVICYHIEKEAKELFNGKIELDESYFSDEDARASEVEERLIK